MLKMMRWLLPAALVVIWLGVGALGGPYFGRLAEVQSQSAEDFLPATADSTRVRELQREVAAGTGIPAIIIVTNEDGIPQSAQARIGDLLGPVGDIDGVAEVLPPIPSETRTTGGDPEALAAFAMLRVEADPASVVEEIRDLLVDVPEGFSAYVTGPAGFTADLTEAFGGIDGILLLVAIVAVLLILLIVYRSPILPLVVLFTAVSALGASVVVVYWMASAGWIVLNGQAQGILFILVVGAATDYSLLLVARYRDALRAEPSHRRALMSAWRGVLEPIAASASTVIAGLLVLLLSDLNSNQALGPVAAVGIVCSFVAGLTLLPALLALIGRPAFFPVIPKPTKHATDVSLHSGVWARVAKLVQRRPRVLWITSAAILAMLAIAAPRLDATGLAQSELFIGEVESVDGQAVLAEYFTAGAGTPVVVIAPADRAGEIAALVEEDPAISIAAQQGEAFEWNGRDLVEISATLTFASDSEEALDAVDRLRSEMATLDAGVLIGGSSATNLDTRDAAMRDLWTIVPIVLVVITLILFLLLRAALAPVLLIATTVLSYLAALGIAALVFEFGFGFPGADPAVPLFAFVFLVALGIDYNIFLTTRVREESLEHGTRPGILRGLRATGGVITSAGVVLAATFAALAVIPILFLVQIAFIVALGVLIDAIVVRSILVPGLLYDIGSPIWWPSKRAREERGG